MLHEIESQVSTETVGSDIDRINAAKAGEKVYVGEHTAAMLEICGQLYKQTGGAFSPALYNLSRLWGFTPEFEGMYTVPRAEPSSQEIAEALSVSSFDDVRVEGNVVVKEKDDVRLDLGGIAKGYMSDCVRALIAERYPDFSGTFSVMSNSVLMGQKQEDAVGLGYTATLENPRADVTGGVSANGALYFTGLSDVAVSTSADNYRFYVYDGTLYKHIIDPFTEKAFAKRGHQHHGACAALAGECGCIGGRLFHGGVLYAAHTGAGVLSFALGRAGHRHRGHHVRFLL